MITNLRMEIIEALLLTVIRGEGLGAGGRVGDQRPHRVGLLRPPPRAHVDECVGRASVVAEMR